VPIQSKASSIAAARSPLLLLLLLLIAVRLLPLVLATGAAKDSQQRRSDAARPVDMLLTALQVPLQEGETAAANRRDDDARPAVYSTGTSNAALTALCRYRHRAD
jgi:hypothetical protein